jgi:shikimate dehydrogenase
MITGRTALYGVVGHPVGHSLSPAMHNAAYREVGIDAAYVPLAVAPERLAEALRGAHALGFQGLNVTVPHKQRAAELCQRLDPVASLCGAVNTLRRAGAGWEGFNTDAPACLALVEGAAGAAPGRDGRRALVLGAGGAALAGAWALLRMGHPLGVAARRRESAEELCRRMGAAFPEGPPAVAIGWDEAPGAAREAAVVVNATTIGLAGQPGALPAFALRRGQIAVDFVYGDTAFAGQARAGGATLVTGEQILVRQGALAFTLWTGKPAPEAAMAAALRGSPHTS